MPGLSLRETEASTAAQEKSKTMTNNSQKAVKSNAKDVRGSIRREIRKLAANHSPERKHQVEQALQIFYGREEQLLSQVLGQFNSSRSSTL